LDATFPVGVVATHGERRVLGVTVNAESAEEAEADLSDALEAFGDSIGEEEELLHSFTCGDGVREQAEMLDELRRWAQRRI
jgi:predicted RNase H-like HicB family nuclease